MRITIAEARRLVEAAMQAEGQSPDEAVIIADHLIDCELRGVQFGGLPRALSILERLAKSTRPRAPISVVRDTPVSALVEGGDQVGYLVAHRATTIAIEKAKASGIGMVAANDTWYTGMFSYYMEMATRESLVAMAIGNASPRVAPFGSTEGWFGTNPIAFGFPSADSPVIWDIGTSAIMAGEVALAQRLGQELPPGVAFDRDGNPTRDPVKAGEGAYASWGGYKGSGLAMMVQLMGMMCGTLPFPPLVAGCGYLIMVVRPDLFMSTDVYKDRVAEYSRAVRAAKPIDADKPTRMPFDRSVTERRRRLAEDAIEVAESVHARLKAAADQRT
ncbi:MAG: Ldh family oxidoreductase [Casimicrobiaceae bacterium]